MKPIYDPLLVGPIMLHFVAQEIIWKRRIVTNYHQTDLSINI